MKRGQNTIKGVPVSYNLDDIAETVKYLYEEETGKRISYKEVRLISKLFTESIYDELTKHGDKDNTLVSIKLGKLGKITRGISTERYISNNIESFKKNSGKVVAPKRYVVRFKVGSNLASKVNVYAKKPNGSYDYGKFNNVSKDSKLFK